MNCAKQLSRLIDTKKANIAVIGLGYVGLPIALEFAKKGFFVYGLDKNRRRVAALRKGNSYITDIASSDIKKALKNKRFCASAEEAVLRDSDVIIICVPTPLRKTKVPNISYIIEASRTVARYSRPGQLIVLESTTYPGTTRDIVLPILEKGPLREGEDIFLAFSPERINPGDKRYTFARIPKVAGGVSTQALALTKRLYSKVIDKVIGVSSVETAEVVKLLENTFRIVNIGLINEFAMLCGKLNIDAWEVVEAAKTKPFGFMPFYPGPGLGGHCIPADPLYLSWKARKVGFKARMIDLASTTNLSMPRYVVQKAAKLLSKAGKKISRARVLILGVTYKKDVKDLRESPALEIIEQLQKRGAKASYSDPHIPYLKIGNIDLRDTKMKKSNIEKNDLVILVTDHKGFDYKIIAKNAGLILDTRNAFEANGVTAEHIIKL